MKNLFSYLYLLTFLICGVAKAQVSSPVFQKHLESNKLYRKAYLEHLHNKDQLLKLLNSHEQAEELVKDKKKNLKDLKRLPRQLEKELSSLDKNIVRAEKKVATVTRRLERHRKKARKHVTANDPDLVAALSKAERIERVEQKKYQDQIDIHNKEIEVVKATTEYQELSSNERSARRKLRRREANVEEWESKSLWAHSDESNARREVSNIEDEIRSAEWDLSSAESRLSHAESSLWSAESRLSSAESEGNEAAIQQAKWDISRAESEIWSAKSDIDSARNAKYDAENRLPDAERAAREALEYTYEVDAELEKAERRRDRAHSAWRSERRKLKNFNAQNIDPIQEKVDALTVSMKKHKKQADLLMGIAEDISEKESELIVANTAVTDLEKRRTEIPVEIKAAIAQVPVAEKELETAQASVETAKQNYNQSLQALNTEVESLETLLEENQATLKAFYESKTSTDFLTTSIDASVQAVWQFEKDVTNHNVLAGKHCLAWGDMVEVLGESEGVAIDARLEIISTTGLNNLYQEPYVQFVFDFSQGAQVPESFELQFRGARKYTFDRFYYASLKPGQQVYVSRIDDRERIIKDIRAKTRVEARLINDKEVALKLRMSLKGSAKASKTQNKDCGLDIKKFSKLR